MNPAIQIFDYHLWANDVVFKHLKELPSEICYQQVKSVFPSLYDTLFHMYQIDYVWLRTLNGDSFDHIIKDVNQLTDTIQEKNLDLLDEKFVQIGNEYRKLIREIEDLHEKISIQHPRYGKLTTSYLELLQHVANHGTYHRGNITAILRQLGYKGPSTDYVWYLFEQKK
ncbi:damage-inducible protein DinB [Bacillus sp. V3-13]|uniref:DinB family protein n=1 Tax=Bacillus sp. V3-13 TaxID=2053728 RepID=UPI000C761B1C|nr:DinB family protein [Bacillus sp. V3-13]PLR77057.1 damage-inducible protein DinB [Bacillus sp. V3-13]